jgi:hypothetical protein
VRARLAVPTTAATVVLVILLALKPISTSRALAIWVLILAGLVLGELVRSVRSGDGARRARRFEAALRVRKAAPSPPVELLRMERELELGIGSAEFADRRLLPLLRTAAAARLGARHGIDLDRRPEAARALLGDDVWELLRPDRPKSDDRYAPGIPRATVVAVIEHLESL